MALTITDVVSSFGSYYQQGSQSVMDLLGKLYRGTAFDNLFTVYNTNDTVIRKVRVTSGSIVQAFQSAFTANGTATFTPVQLDLQKIKFDAQETFDELEDSYIGFLAGNNLDRKTWPIARYIVERILLPQMMEDIEMNLAYKGVYAAPTPGTAGAVGAAMDGFKKHIQTIVASGALPAGNVINTGALSATPDTLVGQIETFVEGIPDNVRTKPGLTIALNPTHALNYKKGMRSLYNANYAQESDLLKVANFPNITISEQPAMAGDGKIFASFKDNLILGVKRGSRSVEVESVDRSVKMWHDHWRVYGVADARLFFTNDIGNA
jgi:hypothetical protein